MKNASYITAGETTSGQPEMQGSIEVTTVIAPVSGIYAISPPTSPNYLSDPGDESSFYNSQGLDGIFISVAWSDLESTQSLYRPFTTGNPLHDALFAMITTNPSLKFALAINAGPVNTPAYITTGPVKLSPTETYTVPNVLIPSVQVAGQPTIYSPFPFDPGFIFCYEAMLTNVLTTLATTTIAGIVPLSRMTSMKLGLYTGKDAEIEIASWDTSQTGTARSEAPLWLHAFTTPSYLGSHPPGFLGSSWPMHLANTWQSTVTNAWVSFVEWLQGLMSNLATTYSLPNLNTVTFGAPLHTPYFSFPLIAADGSIIPAPLHGNPDNSPFVRSLMFAAAAAVNNPIQTVDTVLSIIPQNTDLPPASQYPLLYDNASFDQLINLSGTTNLPVMAFQTNNFGKAQPGTGAGSQDDQISLDNQSPHDSQTFIALLEDGLRVPNQTSAPPYTETYPYSPYIEIHYPDPLKWNGTTNTKFTASVFGNVIETVHVVIFGS